MNVFAPQTGHIPGISNVPQPVASALTTLGIILLAFITSNFVPTPPIPRRSHSLMLQRDALEPLFLQVQLLQK